MTTDPKRVLITGGGSGIGLEIARAFDRNGDAVVIAGRNRKRLEETGLPFVQMDVTDDAAISETAAQQDPVDIMIACAGGAETMPALDTPKDVWDRMIALNLTSVYACSKAFVPPMKDRGWGRFIAIASTASIVGYPYAGAYAAAKHGVLGWVKTLALELARSGVTANAICPGYTDTPMIGKAVETIAKKTGRSEEEALKTFTRSNPSGRLVSPAEIAAAARWLASPEAASVNGQAIVIDGGETAG